MHFLRRRKRAGSTDGSASTRLRVLIREGILEAQGAIYMADGKGKESDLPLILLKPGDRRRGLRSTK